jgi:DUF1365 family protein
MLEKKNRPHLKFPEAKVKRERKKNLWGAFGKCTIFHPMRKATIYYGCHWETLQISRETLSYIKVKEQMHQKLRHQFNIHKISGSYIME